MTMKYPKKVFLRDDNENIRRQFLDMVMKRRFKENHDNEEFWRKYFGGMIMNISEEILYTFSRKYPKKIFLREDNERIRKKAFSMDDNEQIPK